MDDPRLTAHPDWLKEFRDFAWSDSSSLTLHQSARIERTEKGFQICIYNHTDYDALLAMLENRASRPRRTSGPTCVAAGVGPCFHGEMG